MMIQSEKRLLMYLIKYNFYFHSGPSDKTNHRNSRNECIPETKSLFKYNKSHSITFTKLFNTGTMDSKQLFRTNFLINYFSFGAQILLFILQQQNRKLTGHT